MRRSPESNSEKYGQTFLMLILKPPLPLIPFDYYIEVVIGCQGSKENPHEKINHGSYSRISGVHPIQMNFFPHGQALINFEY